MCRELAFRNVLGRHREFVSGMDRKRFRKASETHGKASRGKHWKRVMSVKTSEKCPGGIWNVSGRNRERIAREGFGNVSGRHRERGVILQWGTRSRYKPANRFKNNKPGSEHPLNTAGALHRAPTASRENGQHLRMGSEWRECTLISMIRRNRNSTSTFSFFISSILVSP
jgi:hypothetical protein